MTSEELEDRGLISELVFSATRSGGAGGQNVNKVNTRVELRFNVGRSAILTEEEKNLLLEKLTTRINLEGDIVMTSQTERSQLGNKEKVTVRFLELVAKALTIPRKRKRTKPSQASRQKRLDEKKKLSEKKDRRRDSFG